MLGRVLWRNIRIGQMIGAGLGALFGMLLLLSTFQLFLDFRQVLTSDDGLLSSRYMVVNKTLSSGKTVGGILGHVLGDQDSIIGRLGRRMSKEPIFSEQEVDDLLALEYVEDAAPFSRSRFEVFLTAEIGGKVMPFSTNLFFDGVPDRFLDLQDERWNWEGRGQDVPIVIPKSYLNLYNFGFAPSYALPQLSAESFDMVTFRLDVSEPGRGRRRSERFIGRIVGFTDRLNSPLVPESFLDFANAEFAADAEGGEAAGASRVILAVRNSAEADLAAYLQKHGYETNKEKLRESRLAMILQSIAFALGGIATLVILLSLLIFVMAFQLMITRTERDVRLLTDLGVRTAHIVRHYAWVFALSMVVLALVDLAAFLVAKRILTSILAERGLELPGGMRATAVALVFGVSIVIVAANTWSIRRSVRRIAVQPMGS